MYLGASFVSSQRDTQSGCMLVLHSSVLFFSAVEKAEAKISVSKESDIFVEICFPISRFCLPVGVLGTSL